jgi:hypothetical protein
LSLRHAAAYLGSWALCLQPVLERLPREDAQALQQALLEGDRSHPVSYKVLSAAAALEDAGVSAARLPNWELCTVNPRRKAQRDLSRLRAEAARQELLTRCQDPQRLRSCGGVGAGAFLLSPAGEGSTEMLDGVFSHSCAWRLGLHTTSPGSTCQIQCHRRGGKCGEALDPKGNHYATCKFGGHKTLRHSRLVLSLRGILRESGAAVYGREVPVEAWRRADGTGARLDIAYTSGGVTSYVDVTVRHPRAQKYRAQAAVRDGAAAKAAERAKRLRYPAVASAGLLPAEPFAVETFGRIGPASLQLLHCARQRRVEADASLRGWAGCALFQRWLCVVSVSLQHALFDSARAAWGDAGAASNGLLMACLPFGGITTS